MKSVFDARLTRRELLRNSAVFGAATFAATTLSACGLGKSSSEESSGKIVIGAFQDNALAPLRDTFFKRFTDETGIKVQYNETNYDSWYQNAKNDGLNKTGAYDIYIMDDNWVPEFAAAGILIDLEAAGLKPNPDLLENGLNQGYWPPKVGPRLKDVANDEPEVVRAPDRRRRPDALLQLGPVLLPAGDVGRDLRRDEGQGESAEYVRVDDPRGEGQSDHADLPPGPELLRRGLRER